MIFSLERVLSGGTKLTLELANALGKPVLQTTVMDGGALCQKKEGIARR